MTGARHGRPDSWFLWKQLVLWMRGRKEPCCYRVLVQRCGTLLVLYLLHKHVEQLSIIWYVKKTATKEWQASIGITPKDENSTSYRTEHCHWGPVHIGCVHVGDCHIHLEFWSASSSSIMPCVSATHRRLGLPVLLNSLHDHCNQASVHTGYVHVWGCYIHIEVPAHHLSYLVSVPHTGGYATYCVKLTSCCWGYGSSSLISCNCFTVVLVFRASLMTLSKSLVYIEIVLWPSPKHLLVIWERLTLQLCVWICYWMPVSNAMCGEHFL